MTNRRSFTAALCAGLSTIAGAGANSAAAQDAGTYPDRPIKLVVGFAPGGSSDTVARILVPRMAEALKQTVVVDNRPGAGGNIAVEFLIRAPADGYTVLLGTIGSLAVNHHLSKLSYNPVSDTAAVSMAVTFSNVLVVNAASDIRTLDDYVRQGRLERSALFFGSSGIGSSGHLAGELLKSAAGLSNQHVAYRGGAPAMNDLLGGTLGSMFSSPSDALQFVAAGKLRPLAVTGSKRLETLPNVPTIAESGYPGFEAVNWYAFVVGQRTPAPIVRRLNAAVVAALTDPGVAAQLRKLGLDPAPSTPEEAARYIRQEDEKWAAVVRKAGIKIQ